MRWKVENVERPVDLYKAIFSDDEDAEEQNNTSNQVEDPQMKMEVANTTLNRLMAGDFLESLGKELGLSLPPGMPPPVAHKEAIKVDKEKTTFTDQRFVKSSKNGESRENKWDDSSVEDDRKENRVSKAREKDRVPTKPRNWSSSFSGDERGRKRSWSHRRKSSSDSDTTNDSDRHRSRSRKDEKGSSREKRSKKHSKHRKHRRKDPSPSRSHRSSEHEKRKKRNSRYDE